MNLNTFRLAARQWDHVLPIALGDIPGANRYQLERRGQTPDLWLERGIDGGETSFSRYVRARAAGDDSVTALPIFLMRGFRHRCIITTKKSRLHSASDLADTRVGLTGWPDSGNTWTRAILRHEGVELGDVDWVVGRLTASHPVIDRIGPVRPTVRVTQEDATPLIEMLQDGMLDAVMTPFMPPSFYDVTSRLRPLYVEPSRAEQRYFEHKQFIPGIHLLAVQTRLLEHDADEAWRLLNLFEEAKTISRSRREKLQDVTPWQNEAFAASIPIFGHDWLPYGWDGNRRMVSEFQDELIAQGLLSRRLTEDELFPFRPEPTSERTDVA